MKHRGNGKIKQESRPQTPIEESQQGEETVAEAVPSWGKRIWANDRFFAFCVAFLVSFLVFCPFLGQAISSDVVTFLKGFSDSFNELFPAFMQAWKLPILGGVDLGSFNGAAELALRGNHPMANPIYILFSLMGKLTDFTAAYILLYAFHMLIFVYYGLLLAIEHFNLDRKGGVLFAVSSLTSLLIAIVFLGFYIIASLIPPLLYLSIRAVKKPNWFTFVAASFAYFLTLLGGFAILSVFSCGMGVVFTLLYMLFWQEEKPTPRACLSILIPPVMGGVVVLPYYVQMLQFLKTTGGGTGYTMFNALSLALPPKDLLILFTQSCYAGDLVESAKVMYVGWAWLTILALFFIQGRFLDGFPAKRRIFIKICFVLWGTFFLIAMGDSTPFGYWFYSLVPIVGTTHVTARYMLLIMPIFFLAASVVYQEQKIRDDSRIFLICGLAGCAALMWLLLKRDLQIEYIEISKLITELLFGVAFFFSERRKPRNCLSIALILLCTLTTTSQTFFYTGMQLQDGYFKGMSAVYNEEISDRLDAYIGTLPVKARYRFIDYEKDGGVPVLVPLNYSWYEASKYPLTAYLGFGLHLAVSMDYVHRMPWFDVIDWQYVADTRGDLAILDSTYVTENWEMLTQYLDQEHGTQYLDPTHQVFMLKRFIPSHYTGVSFVEDVAGTLDNGYFYCPFVMNDALLDFSTDEHTYYSITLNMGTTADIAFLPYASPHYHYYVDGDEVEVAVEDGKSYIPVQGGIHRIEVKYINPLTTASTIAFASYYLVLLGTVGAGSILHLAVRKKKQLNANNR